MSLRILYLGLAVLGLSGGCAPLESSTSMGVRSQWSHTLGGSLLAKVWVEGAGGTSLDGALVKVFDPVGDLQILRFDGAQGLFYGSWAQATSGVYTLEVSSRSGGEYVRTVDFLPLKGKPVVDVLRDEGGNSALEGTALSTTVPWTLSWGSPSETTLYTAEIVDAQGQKRWRAQAREPLATVPASSLEKGSYTLWVTAFKIQGDPALKAQDYSLVSQAPGPGMYFRCE